jgi:formate hydrogenlyase subunit 3/multisubunit Na+/H+ antiporter MnhD subunit
MPQPESIKMFPLCKKNTKSLSGSWGAHVIVLFASALSRNVLFGAPLMLLAAVAFAAKYMRRVRVNRVLLGTRRTHAYMHALMFCALTRCAQRDVGRNDNLTKKKEKKHF